jgi:hypothetical protein
VPELAKDLDKVAVFFGSAWLSDDVPPDYRVRVGYCRTPNWG